MSTITKHEDRGRYHFSPAAKWMNDPNGMVFFEGEYHLFFQHHPHGMTWGPMHWGHAVSRDLVTWEELDIALAPDEHGAIFSGSAVVDWNNTTGFFDGEPGLVAIFTHHIEAEDGRPQVQTQSLAYSKDKGRTWTKYEGNPVLSEASLPDFRDPKVFWHEETGRWVMILACGQTVRLYHSPDLKAWTFASEFGEGIGFHDGVWECPDLFPLTAAGGEGGVMKWVMLVSIGDSPEYPEGSRTQYFTGDFDGQTFTPDKASHEVRWLDGGRDNYAGVSWSDVPAEDGRRLYVGWMSNWKYANLTPTEGFRGAMTLPRELRLEAREDGLVLIQEPVRELERIRVPVLSLTDVTAAEAAEALGVLRLESYELNVTLPAGASFSFDLRKGRDGCMTRVGVSAETNELYVDRTASGRFEFHEQFAGVHRAQIGGGSQVELRIFVDRSSVEVFADGGRAVITDLIFPHPDSKGLSFTASDPLLELASLAVYSLQPAGSPQEQAG